jgi:hypothetical protein
MRILYVLLPSKSNCSHIMKTVGEFVASRGVRARERESERERDRARKKDLNNFAISSMRVNC